MSGSTTREGTWMFGLFFRVNGSSLPLTPSLAERGRQNSGLTNNLSDK